MLFNITSLDPILSILFGILILLFPKFLNYLVAAYLLIVGFIGLGIFR